MHRKVAYYPVGGMFYMARKGVYLKAFPPRGFRLRVLPRTAVRLVIRGTVYHYADGVFYQPIDEEFQIVRPPEGAIVKDIFLRIRRKLILMGSPRMNSMMRYTN
ncbi:MAG: hypothetical protein MUO53_05945 [Maribacter sp.]|nr:hypothetical protein [Maribacter sp.]